MENSYEIVEKFEPLIKASIKNYYKNCENYEDAYQDGVLRLLELVENFNPNGNISIECYFKYYMKFFYMDKYKKQKKITEHYANNRIITETGEQEIFDTIVDDTDIEAEIQQIESNEFLHKAMETLTDRQKTVIDLKIFKQMKNKEVAEKMKLSEETVKDYYKNARKKLKKELEKLGYNR